MKNKNELVDFARSKIGTHYLYGYKGEKITKAKNNAFASYYKNVWSDSYLKKANEWIGEIAVDCSGLISWCTGRLRGSWEYMETATQHVFYKKGMDLSDFIGWAIWKPGHIGIVSGKDEVIEARGQKYGVVKTKASERDFTHLIKLCDIDYTEKYKYENIGWNKDSVGWWYAFGHNAGEYYKSTIQKIDGHFYAFDSKGYMIENSLQINEKGQIEV